MNIKILLLADIASPHTEKWAVALAKQGFTIGLFSLNKTTSKWYLNYPEIHVLQEGPTGFLSRYAYKFGYFFLLPNLFKTIGTFKPNVVHAHYASSYGLLGALSRFKPFFISAWGSDVFEFPRRSFLHRRLLRWSLSKATRLFSTSEALKTELQAYTSQPVTVVPFGVDTAIFSPPAQTVPHWKLRVGLIKSMEDIYGIQTVLEAAAIIHTSQPLLRFEIFLVGGGSRLDHYRALTAEMQLEDYVTFTGRVSYAEIAGHHQSLDIFLNMTRVDESFGVSVLEAMACAKPVIVSDVPGMREIVKPGTGIIIERENPQQLAKAIMKLCESRTLRQSLGEKAREHVQLHYEFKNNLAAMVEAYRNSLAQQGQTERIRHHSLGESTLTQS